MVQIEELVDLEDRRRLRRLLGEHAELTGSRRASGLLESWEESFRIFRKVVPREEGSANGDSRSANGMLRSTAVGRSEARPA
jgi:glutamate synthase domain-containing protein 3